MKIVISGSAGTGKTTLAKVIAKKTNSLYIPDHIDIILSENGLSSPRQMNNSKAIEIRMEALDRKIKNEMENSTFVSDKGVIDYFAYWLICTSDYATESENKKYYNKVKEHITSIKIQPFILKFGKYGIESNKIRLTNYFHQFRIHSLIKGLYHEFGIKYLEYDYKFEQPIDELMIILDKTFAD